MASDLGIHKISYAAQLGYLEQLCEIQQQDRSLSDVLTLRMPDCATVSEMRDQIYFMIFEVIKINGGSGWCARSGG
jgi:hypothetical protein